MKRLLFCIAFLLCGSVAYAQGRIDQPERLNQIRLGVTTDVQVEQLLGKPARRMKFPREGIDSMEYHMRDGGEQWLISIAIKRDGKEKGTVRDIQRRRSFGS